MKLSKGAQVKNKIVPAISHMRISSGIAPNNSIPPRDPREVAIRIFCIKCHLKNSLIQMSSINYLKVESLHARV